MLAIRNRRVVSVMALGVATAFCGCQAQNAGPGRRAAGFPEDLPFSTPTDTQPSPARKANEAHRVAEVRRLARYAEELSKLAEVSKKWELTVTFLARNWDPVWLVPAPAKWTARFQLLGGLEPSRVWLKTFPEVCRHLDLRPEDLETIAVPFDSDPPVHPSTGDDLVAHGWLKVLTGVDFKTRREFERWFESRCRLLRWHKSKGRFVMGPASD